MCFLCKFVKNMCTGIKFHEYKWTNKDHIKEKTTKCLEVFSGIKQKLQDIIESSKDLWFTIIGIVFLCDDLSVCQLAQNIPLIFFI